MLACSFFSLLQCSQRLKNLSSWVPVRAGEQAELWGRAGPDLTQGARTPFTHTQQLLRATSSLHLP